LHVICISVCGLRSGCLHGASLWRSDDPAGFTPNARKTSLRQNYTIASVCECFKTLGVVFESFFLSGLSFSFFENKRIIFESVSANLICGRLSQATQPSAAIQSLGQGLACDPVQCVHARQSLQCQARPSAMLRLMQTMCCIDKSRSCRPLALQALCLWRSRCSCWCHTNLIDPRARPARVWIQIV
jgi:hypothetical protein